MLQGSFQIDDIRVTTHHLNHPALTLAYRLEADGASIVYACDHEAYSHAAADGTGKLDGPDLRHAAFANGADLLIHDSQYTAAEYPAKVNWGHSTIEYAMLVAREAGVRQLALTHHDPLRTDEQLDELVESARATMRAWGSPIHVFAAAEGQAIDVKPAADGAVPAEPAAEAGAHAIDTTESVQTILLVLRDPEISSLFAEAIAADPSIRGVYLSHADHIRAAAANDRLSVAVLEHGPDHDALALAEMIAANRAAGERRRLPVLVVADREYPGGEGAGIVEWIVKPFTSAYAQAKLQAWVHRGTSRWKKAAIPHDEERRLASLHATALLDTAPDERFDRITRLASRLFAVPVALVTLVDRERQWFKSCVGLQIGETPRESSFCAHAVLDRGTLVVNDALVDQRFAENPLVVTEPRIRFYAGAPLILRDGSCVGSLCVLDRRPRWFAAADIQLLEDLRDLAVNEIEHEQATSLKGA